MQIWDFLQQVPGALEYLVLLAAAVGAFLLLKKAVWNPIKGFHNKVNSGMDTLLGYPAVLDPGSGKELKAQTPPLALRVDTLEEAITKMVDSQEKLLGLHERLVDLEEWRKEHAEWSEKWVKEIQDDNLDWRKEHEHMHLLAHQTAEEFKKPQPE